MSSSGRVPQPFNPYTGTTAPVVAAGDLPLQRIYRWERERAGAPCLTQPVHGRPRHWTWAQAMEEARRMAAWMIAQDWPAGSRVAILSKNCAWWVMAEYAIWMAGHVSVPVYASLRAQSVRTLLEHCEPVACFLGAVEDPAMASEGVPRGDPANRLSGL